jgi:ribonuclease Z
MLVVAFLYEWGQIKVPVGKIDVLFITYYHSDHVSGIPDVWLTGWLGPVFGRRKGPFHVIGPTGAKNLMTNLEKAYTLDVSIREADEKLPPQGIAVDVEEFDKDGVVGGVRWQDHAIAGRVRMDQGLINARSYA